MIYLFRNTEEDFLRWCRFLLPNAITCLDSFSHGELDIYQHYQTYNNALLLKSQFCTINLYLDSVHSAFFNDVLLAGKTPSRTPVEQELYKDIFTTWQTVCFPLGRTNIKTIDSILLGGELRRLRLKHNLSAQQTADLIGITVKSLYSYESGKTLPKLDIFYKLCSIYDVPVGETLLPAETYALDPKNHPFTMAMNHLSKK